MGVSKKKFVDKFLPDLSENPKKFLRGHKIQSSQWSLFTDEVNGPAMQTQLLYFGHMLKGATKGAMSLKAAKNLRIFTYKTEGQLTDNITDDVETFINGLGDEDVNQFENDENIHIIGFYPNQPNSVVTLKFPTLMRNGYKGKYGLGQFVAIMFGNSAVRTQELKFAKAKAKINAKKVKKIKSPAVVKASLKKAANRKLGVISNKLGRATSNRDALALELQQFDTIAGQFGATDGASLKRKLKSYDTANDKILSNMTAQEELILDMIQTAQKAGNTRLVNKLVKKANSPAINLLMSDKANSSADFLGGRKSTLTKDVRAKRYTVKKLKAKLEQMAVSRMEAKTAGIRSEYVRIGKNIASVKLRIKKTNAEISRINAKLKMTKTIASGDFNKATITSKSALLASVNQQVAQLTARGLSIEQSLQQALAKVNIKEQVKQQIIEEATINAQEGLPVQIAAQQAIQSANIQQSSGGSFKDAISEYL